MTKPTGDPAHFFVDGGQYRDGTTDVTRTVPIGEPSAEMRDRFTRVLKGHIALATAVFPEGTRGSQLDSFARQHLWQAGLDYAHGTGHGVGSFLAVHEGPQRISPVGSSQAGGDEPLKAGMILSNEPGYYKTGEYGIRVENLVLVVPIQVEGAEKELLGFETLTFAPIDRDLIEPLLTPRSAPGSTPTMVSAGGGRGAARRRGAAWLEAQCRPLETRRRRSLGPIVVIATRLLRCRPVRLIPLLLLAAAGCPAARRPRRARSSSLFAMADA